MKETNTPEEQDGRRTGRAETGTPGAVLAESAVAASGSGSGPSETAASASGGPSETAAALLEAGRRIFARYGYEGASVRAITSDAGANLAAITYHFGSKRELYDRVVESVVEPLAVRVEAVVGGGGSVLERAESVVRTYFDHLATHPELPQLMMQQLTLGAEPSGAVVRPLRRVHGALTALVAEGQERGEVRAGPRPVLGIFLLSVPVHLAIVRPVLERFIGIDLQDAGTREVVTASAVQFVREGLRARPESSEG